MESCFRDNLGLLEKGSVLRSESRLAIEPYFVDRKVPVLDISPSKPCNNITLLYVTDCFIVYCLFINIFIERQTKNFTKYL